MKWFKHMADMSNDVKIKRIIKNYGVEGYGLYNYIIELIVRKLDTATPMPDLEETSNDIATDLNMDTVRVEEIMWFCIQQGLFEQDEMTGRLAAHKVYKFLETSQTRSQELKKMIAAYKQASDTVSDNHKPSLPEENRLEQNRREEKRDKHPSTGGPMNKTTYDTLVKEYGKSRIDDYMQRVADYCESKGKKYKDHAATARNWLKRDGVKPSSQEYRVHQNRFVNYEAEDGPIREAE